MVYHSVEGKRFGYDDSTVIVNGRRIGSGPIGLGRGKTVYVDSNVAGSDGSSPDSALATLDSAFDKVPASQGDVIVVMPGHTEAVVAAAGILCDVAGVTIVGLGTGRQRPVINFGTLTSATISVTAANVNFYNM